MKTTTTDNQAGHTPGVREDFRTGQFIPTVDGKDVSPTSFDKERALQIATQAACRDEHLALLKQRDALLAALEDLFVHCEMVHKHWGDDCNRKEADAAKKAGLAAIAQARGES